MGTFLPPLLYKKKKICSGAVIISRPTACELDQDELDRNDKNKFFVSLKKRSEQSDSAIFSKQDELKTA